MRPFLISVSPEANRQKATIQVRVKVLTPDEFLKPDMNATVSFLSPKKLAATRGAAGAGASRPAERIRVPATAVRDGAVFVVENGKAVRRAVTTANMVGGGGREVEVSKGLIGGEDLIVSPPESLRDGARVKATDGKAEKEQQS